MLTVSPSGAAGLTVIAGRPRSCPLGLACKEFERVGHEIGVELGDCPVYGIRIDNEFAIRQTSRQITASNRVQDELRRDADIAVRA